MLLLLGVGAAVVDNVEAIDPLPVGVEDSVTELLADAPRECVADPVGVMEGEGTGVPLDVAVIVDVGLWEGGRLPERELEECTLGVGEGVREGVTPADGVMLPL